MKLAAKNQLSAHSGAESQSRTAANIAQVLGTALWVTGGQKVVGATTVESFRYDNGTRIPTRLIEAEIASGIGGQNTKRFLGVNNEGDHNMARVSAKIFDAVVTLEVAEQVTEFSAQQVMPLIQLGKIA